jgi:hypothetical protein
VFKLCGGFPIPDNAFLPEISLQAKLPCDGLGPRSPVRPPGRRDRSESRVSISAGNVPGPSNEDVRYQRTSGPYGPPSVETD